MHHFASLFKICPRRPTAPPCGKYEATVACIPLWPCHSHYLQIVYSGDLPTHAFIYLAPLDAVVTQYHSTWLLR